MSIDKTIQSRRSIRKYKLKSPNWRRIIEAIDAAKYAPMAGEIFSLYFLLVDNDEKIQKIAKWCEQDFIMQAKYVVLFLTNPKKTVSSYGKRGEVYCQQQTGAAIQNFLLKLTEAKLSTCWIGHFNERMIKQMFRIPEDINIEAIFPIGIAGEKPKRRREIDLNTYLYFNEWKNKRMTHITKVEGRAPEGFGRDFD